MIFNIKAQHLENGDTQTFIYDNETNTLQTEAGNVFEFPEATGGKDLKIGLPHSNKFSKVKPLKKSKLITTVKIQMGLSCNYACDYCSQKFVERPKETSKKDIDAFMKLFSNLEFSTTRPVKIEFWGGEPFVYWKTFKPLAETIKKYFTEKNVKFNFGVITNGSLLTDDICDWLYDMGFSLSISHDGPGQHVRGPDPFEDEQIKNTVLKFYQRMRPEGRISFNSMLNSKNHSRKEIHSWFVNFTGDPGVSLGEGGFVDAYDDDGLNNSLISTADKFKFRKKALTDILETNGDIGFNSIINKIDSFTNSVLSHSRSKYLNQKCGMDLEEVIAIDLRGNVITCQNVSALETGPNGESHFGGNISDIDSVEIKTATHWSNRKECPSCPVLHICQGSCMFLDGKYWEASCDNAFSDAIPLFALSFKAITGYIPILIDDKELPLDRQDIWGTIYHHEEKPKKKIIPIKAVTAEKTIIVNGIQVFDQAK
jgi:uncharacterized protein